MKLAIVAIALALLTACKTPIGIKKVGPDRAYAQINSTVLTSGKLSVAAQDVLHRYNLDEPFAKHPQAAIEFLHQQACKDRRRDILYALAELNYASAERQRRGDLGRQKPGADERKGAPELDAGFARVDPAAQPYYLAAAVYAYLYLFGQFEGEPPSAFDRQFRVACDLYNRALVEALRTETPRKIPIESAERSLPVGKLRLRVARPDPFLAQVRFDQMLPADDYLVRGISRRDRTAGLGAPLIGVASAPPVGSDRATAMNPHPKIPITALLRLDGDVCDLSRGELAGSLELYAAYTQHTVRINDQTVPLESDVTAALAYGLEGAQVWKAELAQLLSAEQKIKSGLYMVGPYQPGKIPVVFVHGTASSPGRWAEMFNTLYADPVVRERYQFWYFIYTTGNPILYSAAILRDSLADLVRSVDPDGKDPALKKMVVVGHSQGGLLTRLVATSSGDRFWANASDRPFEEMDLPSGDRELLQRCLFFKPSPFVRRAVFVATPHGGSYRVSGLVERLTLRLFKLPGEVLATGQSIMKTGMGMGEKSLPEALRRGVPTSVSNMKPESPFVKTLGNLPISPEVKIHSVIAVKGKGAPEGGNDGVVQYKSAKLDNVESEFVVRSPHSCQGHPLAIEEIRRILLLHEKEMR